jgi:spore coat polysaccharide biosynthesis predicted glycosyltransferase SpsG
VGMGTQQSISRALFVCRGSVQDGMGHVTRSLAVALEMSRHAKVKFVVLGDNYVNNLLVGRGLDYQIIGRNDSIISTLNGFQPEVVFLDMLTIDQPEFDAVQSMAMTVSLSPIFDQQGRVDMIFSRATPEHLLSTYENSGPVLRSGLDYAVINEHCIRIPEETYAANLEHRSLAVAISMGGADASNKALRVLQSVKRVPSRMVFWVLLGQGYVHSYQSLVDCMSDSPQHEIILAKTNESMWRILGTCSFAILGSGVTTFESAFAGLPSINILEEVRQEFLTRDLVENRVCLSASYPMDDALSTINESLTYFDDNRDELLEMHRRSKLLIDGQGVKRIIEETRVHFRQQYKAIGIGSI